MTAVEAIVEDLKHLPPDRVEEAAWFVHALVEHSGKSKAEILKRTSTALSATDVDEMERAIADACEETDEHTW